MEGISWIDKIGSKERKLERIFFFIEKKINRQFITSRFNIQLSTHTSEHHLITINWSL